MKMERRFLEERASDLVIRGLFRTKTNILDKQEYNDWTCEV